MNENEPKVEMPEPPAGHQWEYRGKEWSKDRATFCYLSTIARVVSRYHDAPAVGAQGHYWEAVPHPIAEENRKLRENLERENAELKNLIDRESEIMGRIDHIALAAELGFNKFRENPEQFLVKVRELKAELEKERMRLAAVGVVAMADTPESAAKARDMLSEYRSASLSDVERRVDECISLREDVAKLREQVKQKESEAAIYRKRIDEPAAYPPPESEWPEKPALPEGCEWVRQGNEGACVVGDISLCDAGDGTLKWYVEKSALMKWIGTVVFRAEKIDHTEGGKYRMLEEGEVIEAGDECMTIDGTGWLPVAHHIGKPFRIEHWRCFMRRRIDFAQQAKDILQARFVTGFPAFREITLDHFVDLIIKATKQ